MAKSKYEKLLEAIEAAQKIQSESVAGEETGQFKQETIEALNQAISAAQEVSSVKDSEPAGYDNALTALVSAVKVFNESVIKAPDQPNDQSETEKKNEQESSPKEIELKGVVLKGWVEGREGIHSIHLKNRIVSFANGRADVNSELAEELQKAGYIE